MAELHFDANTVAPSQGKPDPVPDGWYNMFIEESKIKPTSDGLGTILELKLSNMDGQYANRKFYDNLNIKNNNEVTMKIAYETLSAIGHATGVLQITNTEMLHNIPMKVKVEQTKRRDTGKSVNEIVAYKNINEMVGDVNTQSVPLNVNSPTPPPIGQPPVGQPTPPQVNYPPQQAQNNVAQTPPPVNNANTFNAGNQPQQPWNNGTNQVNSPVTNVPANSQPQQENTNAQVQNQAPNNPPVNQPVNPPQTNTAPPWQQQQ